MQPTLLMPLSFAAIIGGMGTSIGTSVNLIVLQMARDKSGGGPGERRRDSDEDGAAQGAAQAAD